MELHTSKRRWLRFSLRSLLIATALLVVLIAGVTAEVRYVHDRWATCLQLNSNEQAQAGGGAFTAVAVCADPCFFKYPLPDWYRPLWKGHNLAAVKSAGIPIWRRWLGDESFALVKVPDGCTKRDALRLQRLFPEALIYWQDKYWRPQELAALPDTRGPSGKSFLCAD
jgi:hypothetical protein